MQLIGAELVNESSSLPSNSIFPIAVRLNPKPLKSFIFTVSAPPSFIASKTLFNASPSSIICANAFVIASHPSLISSVASSIY